MVGKAITRATGIGPLPNLLEKRGGGKLLGRVFDDAELPRALIHDRNHRIPMASLAKLYQSAAQHSGEAMFGLSAGYEMTPGEFGSWVLYASQAPTLAEAIARSIKTLHLHQTGTEMRLVPRPGGLMAWEYDHSDVATPLFRQHSDHIVPVMIRFMQGFLGHDWRPTRVETGYSAPRHAARLENSIEAAWLFDRPSVAIVLTDAEAQTPNRQRLDQPGQSPLLTYGDVVADACLEWPDMGLENIASIVALRLLEGACDIDGTAQVLGTGCRTLQRRLEAHGLSYRSLVTQMRMRRAKSLIEETDAPLKVICAELGYTHPAHFSRAFCKFYGYPPSRLQRRLTGT